VLPATSFEHIVLSVFVLLVYEDLHGRPTKNKWSIFEYHNEKLLLFISSYYWLEL